MTVREARPDDLEVDLHSLARVVFRSLRFLIPIAVIVGICTYAGLTRVTPQYKATAQILIEASESMLTRPASTDANADNQSLLDEQGVTSQVQLVRSRELAKTVVDKLQLGALPEFDPQLKGPGLLTRLLAKIGIHRDPGPAEERVLDSFYGKLSVYPVDKSRVIVVEFTANDPDLAARIANAIGDQYLVLQQAAKRETAVDATTWLESEISDLQVKVRDAEAKVEAFRSSRDLFGAAGENGATLASQQLTEMNAELARVRAARADAEARASQIKAGLKSGAAFNTNDILKSELIQRLNEQAVALRAQIAQLSATLLPGHPRMRELNAQLADLDRQIRAEAQKLLIAVQNEATLAQAREQEIVRNLDQQKVTTTKTNGDSVQLRALEREAAAQRDLLETYLRRYREALARSSGNYQPANARVISRAAAPLQPSFPKKTAMSAAAAVFALFLGVIFVVLRELARRKPVHALRYRDVAAVEPPAAIASPIRWAEDGSVRRMMPRTPEDGMSGAARGSLASIARRIVEADASRILVTMAEEDPAGGRPLAAVALTRALARAGERSVLVDFRRDGADRLAMGENDELPGFGDLYAGEVSFAQVIFRDRGSSAHFIPGGRKTLPDGWQKDPRFATLIDALEHTYDRLVIDADKEALEALGAAAGLIVLVTEAGPHDAGTIAAHERLTALASGEVLLLVSAPASATEGEAA